MVGYGDRKSLSPSSNLVGQGQGILTEGRRLSTVDLLINSGCFAKKVTNIFNKKGADLNSFVQGGQLY